MMIAVKNVDCCRYLLSVAIDKAPFRASFRWVLPRRKSGVATTGPATHAELHTRLHTSLAPPIMNSKRPKREPLFFSAADTSTVRHLAMYQTFTCAVLSFGRDEQAKSALPKRGPIQASLVGSISTFSPISAHHPLGATYADPASLWRPGSPSAVDNVRMNNRHIEAQPGAAA